MSTPANQVRRREFPPTRPCVMQLESRSWQKVPHGFDTQPLRRDPGDRATGDARQDASIHARSIWELSTGGATNAFRSALDYYRRNRLGRLLIPARLRCF